MRREGIPLSACQILDIRHDERGKPSACRLLDFPHAERVSEFHTDTMRRGFTPSCCVIFERVWVVYTIQTSTPSRHVHFSYVDIGWFRPPRHVRFFIFDMSGWFRPRGDVHLMFPEVSGWFIPFRHLHSLFADVSGWSKPPRHVHFVLLDVINL